MVSLSSTSSTDLTRVFQPATEFKNNPVPSISLNQTSSKTSEKPLEDQIPTFKMDLGRLSGQPSTSNPVTAQAPIVKPQAKKEEKPWWQPAWQGVQQWIAPIGEKVAQIKQKVAEISAPVVSIAQGNSEPEAKPVATVESTKTQSTQPSENWWQKLTKTVLGDKSKETAQKADETKKEEETQQAKAQESKTQIAQAKQEIASKVKAVMSGELSPDALRSTIAQLKSDVYLNGDWSKVGFESNTDFAKLSSLETLVASQEKNQPNQNIPSNTFQLNKNIPLS